jgi:hypothetical protein
MRDEEELKIPRKPSGNMDDMDDMKVDEDFKVEEDVSDMQEMSDDDDF